MAAIVYTRGMVNTNQRGVYLVVVGYIGKIDDIPWLYLAHFGPAISHNTPKS